MAVSDLKCIKVRSGRSIAYVVKDRINYYKNPKKTDSGRLISAYQCTPDTAVEEFLSVKHTYETRTGRKRSSNNAALWRIMQSFKPGEVSPEEANKIGYETAEEFLKGEHQFVVCTHTDHKHIHNHIVWNSTALDCEHKWNNYNRSAMAARAISDRICVEHGLSVVRPKEKGKKYAEWAAEKKGVSWKKKLRAMIDTVLPTCTDYADYLTKMRQAGYEVQTGKKYVSFRAAGQTRFTRMKTLGTDYTEEAVRARLEARQPASARHKSQILFVKKINLLIDIRAKLQAGKGAGYAHWAKLFNVKQTAKTLYYIREHGIADYTELEKRANAAAEMQSALSAKMKSLDGRMKEIQDLKSQIITYSKTSAVYKEYQQTGWNPIFRAQHETEILQHENAKKAFNVLHAEALPKMAQLQQKYAELLSQKQALRTEYQATKAEADELRVIKKNIDTVLDIPDDGEAKEPDIENGRPRQ